MFEYAIKNILKRKTRSVLTVLGIAVLIALVTVISGIVGFQKQKMNAHASAGGAGKLIVQSMLAGTSYPTNSVDLSEEHVQAILNLNGVQRQISSSALFFEIEPPPYPNSPPAIVLTGLERGHETAFTGTHASETRVAAGTKTFSGTTEKWPLILGAEARSHLEKRLGASIEIDTKVELLGKRFSVIGLLEQSNDQVVNHAAIVPIELAQRLVDKPGFVSSTIVYLTNLKRKEEVLKRIAAFDRKLNVVTNDTLARNAREGISLFEALINGINVVVIFGAVILVVTVMLITIKERTREIGVLRAIGASSKMIVKSVFWEILIVSSIGSVLGGLISGFVLRYGLLENLFSLSHIVKYLPLSILIALVAGILPTIKIIRILPVESLRYE